MMVIDRRKRSKTLSEVKLVEKIRKICRVLEISPVQKSFLLINCENMHMSTRILSD